jgi:fido (protein-threonine AMPylation protein)
MYDAIADPYCYKGTAVLENIPGIREPAALIAFETVSVAQRADEPLPGGRLGIRHYCAIHRHLFQDVYRWAGQFRTVRVSKGDNPPINQGDSRRNEIKVRVALQGFVHFAAAELGFRLRAEEITLAISPRPPYFML